MLKDESGSHFFTIYETDQNLTGVYKVRVKVFDAKSTFTNQDLTIDVTVKCTKSIVLMTDVIDNISRLMEIDPPQTYTYAMPTYDVNPGFCLKQDFQLTIQYIGVPLGTAFPTWLSYDVSTLTINTSDALGVKAYNFKVTAFEPLTGLSNTEVEFRVVSSNSDVATAITVDETTLIPALTYLVNDPPALIECPRYFKFPSYVDVQFFYDIIQPYSFLSVVVDADGKSFI